MRNLVELPKWSLLSAQSRYGVTLKTGPPYKTAHHILGSPYDLKLRSSLKILAAVSSDSSVYQRALAQFFDDKQGEKTLEMLQQDPRPL
ncbi:DUF1810 family protein [Pseudomonas syringae]|uniref:DUF1810 family protein n=1 Tax=Pseudomonas syringae TaxID=317 RepID=UPI003F752D0A